MKLRLRNTLSGKIEEFRPIDERMVRMYVCGPTVYDRAHIGNARSAVVFDMLYRLLRRLYDHVLYVRNITDIDDKIYAAAQAQGIEICELTKQTIEMYHGDIAALGVLAADIEPLATEHISDMIEFAEALIAKKAAYDTGDGHVYFSVRAFEQYGHLSGRRTDELISGARVTVSESKRDPLDFVLWKPADEKFPIGWPSPWGTGRPGWHLECSAMCKRYLGASFDIHGGGADLIFPHHENEIAQTCALTGRKTMANYWIHNGHLTIDGEKMSKSVGNVHTVHELLHDFDGEVLRLALLMTHYASPMNFSLDLLQQAKNILNRWYTAIRNVDAAICDEIADDVFEALLDDMNSPKAISLLSGMVDAINRGSHELVGRFVGTCRQLLGVMQKTPQEWFGGSAHAGDAEATIARKIQERAVARERGDFSSADKIRDELLANGITLEDTKDGTIWKTNSS